MSSAGAATVTERTTTNINLLAGERAALLVQGTMAGRAFAANAVLDLEDDHGRRAWLRLLNGTERLGVVEMTLAGVRAPLPRALTEACERYAHLIATVIASTDGLPEARRRGTEQHLLPRTTA